jgi:DNA polymerase-1
LNRIILLKAFFIPSGITMPSHISSHISPFILVDGSSYLYRAFHALPPLSNSKGQPTGAIYGMISMLKRLMKDYQPIYMAVVFDAKGKTFRDELYHDYKATREIMPSELIQQIEPLHHIISAMGIPILMIDNVEADDVIGTLAKKASKIGKYTIISTIDKDLAQLVDTYTTLINTMTNKVLDRDGVKEKFGVWPEQIIDYLTLVGDTSDNIPGVPQVGPKTAAKWLHQYGSLDNIISHAQHISGKVGENFRNAIKQLPLTKSLVSIKLDVNVAMAITDLKIGTADSALLVELFKEMEFKNWLAELLKTEAMLQQKSDENYISITTTPVLSAWIKQLNEAPYIALDTETTSLDYMQAKIVGISFAIKSGSAAYIPFGHDEIIEAPVQLDKQFVLEQLKPLLENAQIKKIGQNIKFDIEVFAKEGISLQGVAFDTMMESYILDSTSHQHNLDVLALKYLGYHITTFAEVTRSPDKQLTFNQVPIDKATQYAAEDADLTLRLHHTLWPRIHKEAGIKHVFEQIEMPLIPVLARMERHGVLIDTEKLATQGIELAIRLQQYEEEAFELAGETFNLNSPKQLQDILFQKLKLPMLQKTPTGQASTADHVLQELALDFPLPRIIIEHRRISKLISTYTNRLPQQVNPITHRIHTSYNQTGTATGRLSSSEPNLQNIPIRTAEGRRIRQAFIAPTGYKIISADYSQIELRLIAHISCDKNLLDAFAKHLDIHQATAAEVWGIPLDQVQPDMRRNAKAINFGLIYGMSAFGLSRQLGIDRQAAQQYIDCYFDRYPGVKAYMEATRTLANDKGYVETLWGRRLYLPDIHSKNIPRQKAAERMAINAPLQGSAADMIKMTMITIDRWLMNEKINASMIMQVHDELVFEAADNECQSIAEQIRHHMMNVVNLQVPLLVSVGIGNNWDEASAH